MATFKIDKVLSSLPGTLVANTVYAVRVGTGFDLYIVDSTGSIAYQINAPAPDNTIPSNIYTANHTAASVDIGAIAFMQSASPLVFTVDKDVVGPLSCGMVEQADTGQVTIVDKFGATPILGGPTNKTAQKGSALWWYCDGAGLIHVHGECAAS